jgi:hypothetical protein
MTENEKPSLCKMALKLKMWKTHLQKVMICRYQLRDMKDKRKNTEDITHPSFEFPGSSFNDR